MADKILGNIQDLKDLADESVNITFSNRDLMGKEYECRCFHMSQVDPNDDHYLSHGFDEYCEIIGQLKNNRVIFTNNDCGHTVVVQVSGLFKKQLKTILVAKTQDTSSEIKDKLNELKRKKNTTINDVIFEVHGDRIKNAKIDCSECKSEIDPNTTQRDLHFSPLSRSGNFCTFSIFDCPHCKKEVYLNTDILYLCEKKESGNAPTWSKELMLSYVKI